MVGGHGFRNVSPMGDYRLWRQTVGQIRTGRQRSGTRRHPRDVGQNRTNKGIRRELGRTPSNGTVGPAAPPARLKGHGAVSLENPRTPRRSLGTKARTPRTGDRGRARPTELAQPLAPFEFSFGPSGYAGLIIPASWNPSTPCRAHTVAPLMTEPILAGNAIA